MSEHFTPLPTRTESDRRGRFPLWHLGVILLAAAFLRLYALGCEGLWCDEAYTAVTVRLPLGEMLSQLVRNDDAPPLFYLIEKLSTVLAGDSEATLRLSSALAGILSVAALLLWSRQRGAGRFAWSAAFLAVATYGVFHARQARSYALLILLAFVLVLSAKEMLFGRRRAGPLLAASGLLLCLTHHVGVVLVLTSLLLWPLGGASRPRLRSWILWHSPPLAVWAISWFAAGSQLAAHAALNLWTAHYWQTHPMGLAPLFSLGAFIPAGLPAKELSVGFSIPVRLSPLWTAFSATLALVCLLAAAFRTRGLPIGCSSSMRRETAVEAAFLFLPLLALLAASQVVTPVYVLTRTDALAYPAFALLVGRGLAALPRRAAGSILLFWAIMSLLSLGPTYGFGDPRLAKGRDRGLAQELVAAGLGREDWVVHTSMTGPTIEYYLGRIGVPHHAAWFPGVVAKNTASEWPAPIDSLQAYIDEAGALRRAMEAVLPEDGAVWIFALVEPSAAEAIARGSAARTLTVDQIGYPVSALVYALVGTQSVVPVSIYDQDWVAGRRAVLRIPRMSWVSPAASASVPGSVTCY